MAKYGPIQGCAGDGDWRVMAVNDEAVHMEENDSSSKDDQSELEPNWQGKEVEAEDNRNITATKMQDIWATPN